MTKDQISPVKRLTSMLLDHVFMTILAAMVSIPLFIYVFSDPFNYKSTHSQTYQSLMYLPIFAFSLYFCKDCLNGQSFAKRKLGFQVVDNKTDKVASPIKCFLRDIFCVIFPIEVFVAFKNPNRRLGDIVAGTKLVTVNGNNNIKHFQYGQAFLCVLFSFALYVTIYKLMGRPS